jgi:transposase
MSPRFATLYSNVGGPSIAPERLLRSLSLPIFYSVHSERMLIEQLQYNLLFRWFVGWRWMRKSGIMRCSARIGSVC